MRVCVPTTGKKGLDEAVSQHFGRAPTFTIVDSETMEFEVIENTSKHFGGTGNPPEIVAAKNVDVVLASGIGPKGMQMLEGLGVKLHVGASGTVKEAIEAFKSGSLQEASPENACEDHKH